MKLSDILRGETLVEAGIFKRIRDMFSSGDKFRPGNVEGRKVYPTRRRQVPGAGDTNKTIDVVRRGLQQVQGGEIISDDVQLARYRRKQNNFLIDWKNKLEAHMNDPSKNPMPKIKPEDPVRITPRMIYRMKDEIKNRLSEKPTSSAIDTSASVTRPALKRLPSGHVAAATSALKNFGFTKLAEIKNIIRSVPNGSNMSEDDFV